MTDTPITKLTLSALLSVCVAVMPSPADAEQTKAAAEQSQAAEQQQPIEPLRPIAAVPIYPASAAEQQRRATVTGHGILDDALRAKAFLQKIPAKDRQRLDDGYAQYEHWHTEASFAEVKNHKLRLAEGVKLYSAIQKRYRKLHQSRYLSEDVKDDIAFNRALLAFRHSQFMTEGKGQGKNKGKAASAQKAALLTDALSYLKAVSATRARSSADVLFLKARIWENLGRPKLAMKLYHQIAAPTSTIKPSLAKMLAMVYSGDGHFERSDYANSIARYQSALALGTKLRNQPIPADFWAMLRYRLMWAYHRNVDEDKAVEIAKTLLKSREPLRSRADQQKLSHDSIDILSEAVLTDFKPASFTAAVKGIGLKRNRITFAEQISERLMTSSRLTAALPVLRWLYHENPLHRGLPMTMTQLALVYGAQEATGLARQTALDLLRVYEPGSLWRRTHGLTALSARDQQPVTRKLLATTLSDLYADALSERQSAKAATLYHQTWLSAFKLSPTEKATTLERLARLKLIQGDVKGSKRYAQQLAALQRRPQHSAAELDVIIALKAVQKSPKASRASAERKLAKVLADYKDSRSFDPDSQVIGQIATYYNDHGQGARAERLWRSQLESARDRYTRVAALRALLQRSLAAKRYRDAIALVERYSLRGKNPIDATAEIDRVYHKALLGRFKAQKAKGQLATAATALHSTLERFGDKIPRHKSLRNLVFQSFAVTSQWPEIIAAYDDRYGHKSKEQAKPSAAIAAAYNLALERSMRYLAAAKEYVAFAGRFPKQAKAKQTLKKALALAEGEEAYKLAGDVAFRIARQQKSLPMAQRYYRVAAKNYALGGHSESVERVLTAQNADNTPGQQALLYITLAHNARAAGNWPKAVRFAKNAIETVKKLPAEDFTYQYRKILAESYYLLARQHVDEVRGKDGPAKLAGLKPRLKQDLATIKLLGRYSKQVAEYGDPEDNLKMLSLMAVTSQNLASQLADVRYQLSKRGDNDTLQAVQRVQTKLRTLATHYFGRADLTLADAGKMTLGDKPIGLAQGAWQDDAGDRTKATALSAPEASMFSPDSYFEGGRDGTHWVH